MRKISETTRKRWIAILVLLLITIVSIILYIRIGKPMTDLVKDSERFREWVVQYGWKSRVIFVAMVCLQVILAVIPGEPLELAAGYVFGAVEGTLLCVAGISLGSIIVFLLVRAFGRKLVELFFSREKIDSLSILHNPKRLMIVTTILFLLPGTPKDLLTYCVGLTPLPLSTWMLICSVGRLPSILTSTVGGHFVGTQNYIVAAIVFLSTALLCGAGLYIYARMKGGKTNAETDSEDTK